MGKCYKVLGQFDFALKFINKGKKIAEEKEIEYRIIKANKYISEIEEINN